MASPSTRSSTRAGGLMTRSELSIHHNNSLNRQILSNTSRRKRLRDATDHEQIAISAKKARVGIQIEPRQTTQPRKRNLVIAPDAKADVVLNRATTKNSTTTTTTTTTLAVKARIPAKYAEKLANGFKHELDRLQPKKAITKDEKRILRSQEGTRFKSDLSAYFPDYDIVIGNEPEETHFLNIDTPIIIVDSKPPAENQHEASSPKPKLRRPNGYPPSPRIKQFPDALFSDLYETQKVDFTFLDKHCKLNSKQDPLPDSYFDIAHKKAERLERSIRNSEKGRAQHEKDQVIRLLEGLQGSDWLKVMGVSGITESKKKDYAPAREYFVKGCVAILDKFRTWREEEKRRKSEKEKAIAEAMEESNNEGAESDGDPPDYSDVDHAAASQLHQEATACSVPLTASRTARKKMKAEPKSTTVDELEKEFNSFYTKRHLREAAVGKHRRSGRSSSAWGQPVPDVTERDFELPEEYRDRETVEANARRKRRDRRISKES